MSLLKAELDKVGVRCLGTQHEFVIMLDPRNMNWNITTKRDIFSQCELILQDL